MIIPKLSLSKISAADIHVGKYRLSPSQVTYLADGCVGREILRLKLKEAYVGFPEADCLLITPPFAPIEGIVLHRLANYCIGKMTTSLIGLRNFCMKKGKNWLLNGRCSIRLALSSILGKYHYPSNAA